MDDRQKLFYFRRFFCGRDDVYAFRVPGKGYRPRRYPEYKLTDKMIIRHMLGDVMLGAYPLMRDGGCDWVAADFDGDNGNAFEEAFKLAEMLLEYDITPICNTSQSGKGVHVRVIFGDGETEGRVTAHQARRFMNHFVKMCGLKRVRDGGAFDRLFPAQDYLHDSTSIGNQIAMPFNMKAAQDRQGTMLLDRQFKTIPLGEETWDAIELHEPFSRLDFIDFLLSLPADKQEVPEGRKGESRIKKSVDNLRFMIENCEFMFHAASGALEYDEWVFLCANLAAYDNMGGRSAFHQLSKPDPRYDHEIAEKKYDNIVGKLQPTTCSRISEYWPCPFLGPDGQCDKVRLNGRGARSPAALPHMHEIAEGVAS